MEHIAHLEHTLEVEYDPGSSVSFDEKKYSFRSFHFHTPAEHLIDGITYPMEMHLVHTFRNKDEEIRWYFVVSVLFKIGKRNSLIQEILDNAPQSAGDTAHFGNRYIDVSEMVDKDLRDYYHYQGSLTTPPYTESVHWVVSGHILEVSSDQIARMNQIEGNNARHIQSVNGRRIEFIHQ